jgi:hypothetical protein
MLSGSFQRSTEVGSWDKAWCFPHPGGHLARAMRRGGFRPLHVRLMYCSAHRPAAASMGRRQTRRIGSCRRGWVVACRLPSTAAITANLVSPTSSRRSTEVALRFSSTNAPYLPLQGPQYYVSIVAQSSKAEPCWALQLKPAESTAQPYRAAESYSHRDPCRISRLCITVPH